MKYIHGRAIPGRASGSGIVRIVFGSLMVLLFLIVVVASIADYHYDSISTILISAFTLGAGGALFLLFGIRALVHSLRPIPMRDPNKNEAINPNNPFFTVSCPTCSTKFDYQKSDLGFRAWYPNGYVVCPGCSGNIRHNAQTNVYESCGQDVYIYPDN